MKKILIFEYRYACSRAVKTPYRTPDTPQKINFNRALTRTRVTIEMAFGRWKRRFGLLHGEVDIHNHRFCFKILTNELNLINKNYVII